jgi:hypothetical protein
MGLLAWVIMGLALWHYTIWLPDRFWGGIVGAFLASIAGAIVSGVIISAAALGTAIPGRHATHLATVLYGVPGAPWPSSTSSAAHTNAPDWLRSRRPLLTGTMLRTRSSASKSRDRLRPTGESSLVVPAVNPVWV